MTRWLMNVLGHGGFGGSSVLASLVGRVAGPDRWLPISFMGKVDVVVDLAVPKFWSLRRGSFELGPARFFALALRPGDTVYDVGANWGFFTLLSAALVGPSGRVAAFEPGSASFAELKKHVSSCGLTHVKLRRCAVTERSGLKANLIVPLWPRSDTGSFLSEDGGPGRGETVETLALDDFWSQEGFPSVRLLKVDIEGSELFALRGACRLISERKCDYIVVEAGIYARRFGLKARETVEWLVERGYSHLYRFLSVPPYLVSLEPGELATLDANICASLRPVEFARFLSDSTLPVVVAGPGNPPGES